MTNTKLTGTWTKTDTFRLAPNSPTTVVVSYLDEETARADFRSTGDSLCETWSEMAARISRLESVGFVRQ